MFLAKFPTLRFGSFTLNVSRYELCRGSERLRVSSSQMTLLILFSSRPGELVTREQIVEALWQEPGMVNTRQGVNTAIARLRLLLEDDPVQPRYLETVISKGYRFIAKVTEFDEPDGTDAPPTGQPRSDHYAELPPSLTPVASFVTAPVYEAGHGSVPAEQAAETGTLARSVILPPAGDDALRPQANPTAIPAWAKTSLFVAAGIALLSVVVWVIFTRIHRSSGLLREHSVVVSDFTNTTGDPVFDGTLRQGLMAQLDQSRFLNLLSDTRINSTLALMERPLGTKLGPELAREVCLRAGAAATIEGSIATLGSEYVLHLQAVSCNTGDVLGMEEATATKKEKVLSALADAAAQLRERLGESLQSVRETDLPPETLTSKSLEALQAYTAGYRLLVVGNNSHPAIPFFQRAIDLDPSFAMAYARLGKCYDAEDDAKLAAENFSRAHELRNRVSQRERFYIDSYYEYLVTGDLEKASTDFRLWVETYPADAVPHAALGNIYTDLGQDELALAEREKALNLDPHAGLNYGNLVKTLVILGQFERAKSVARHAENNGLDSPSIHLDLAWIAWVSGDIQQRDRVLGPLRANLMDEGWTLQNDATIAAFGGQLKLMRQLRQKAIEGDSQLGRSEAIASLKARTALDEVLLGGGDQLARADAQAAVAHDASVDTRATAALALALAGEDARAATLASDLAAASPESTVVRRYYVPMIHAALLLRAHEYDQVLRILEPTVPYERGALSAPLRPAYLRGLALLEAHRGDAATHEFRKLTDRCPGFAELACSVAYLQQSRALALAGQKGQAADINSRFLALWGSADASLLLLREARLEAFALASTRP